MICDGSVTFTVTLTPEGWLWFYRLEVRVRRARRIVARRSAYRHRRRGRA